MSKLDVAMAKHIEYLCLVEQRSFSYLDFLDFKVDGKSNHMTHGIFRNKISVLIKSGKVEWLCDSPQGFYTLKESGQDTSTIANDNHTGVNQINGVNRLNLKDKVLNQSGDLVDEIILNNESSRVENPRIITNNPLYRYIKSIPFGQCSIHDVRLRFEAPGIWNKVYTSGVNAGHQINMSKLQGLEIENRSKDISFSQVKIDDLNISVRIHKTNMVTVIIGCSYAPVTLDAEGIQRLSRALLLVETELKRLVSHIEIEIVNVVARKNWHSLQQENDNLLASRTSSSLESKTPIVIPGFMNWIVTMWHFGADAVHEYSGEKFNCRWELAQDVGLSIYSKAWKTSENENDYTRKIRGSGHHKSVKSRVRIERQEYPKVPLHEALNDKCPGVMEGVEK